MRAGRRHVERMQASARALGLPVPAEDAFLLRDRRGRGRGCCSADHAARHGRSARARRHAPCRRDGRSGASDLAGRLVLPWLRAARAQADEPLPRRPRPRARGRARRRRRPPRRAVERAGRRGDERERGRADRRRSQSRPRSTGCCPGVTRSFVLELLPALGIAVEQRPLGLDELAGSRGVLLTNSLRGLVPARSLDGSALAQPPAELLEALAEALERAETAELLPLPLG